MAARRTARALSLLFASLGVLCLIALTGCGGAANGGSGGSSSTPDFSLSVATGNLSLNEGASETATIFSTALSGFTGSISITVAGLPTGVTVSPPNFTLNGSASQTVQISASASAPVVSGATITIRGTSGTLSHQITLSLTVAGQQSFTLSSPSSLSVIPGTIQYLNVSVTGVNGFAGSVSLSVAGLPAGVTASPSTVFAYPGASTTFAIIASSTASGAATATITGTSGTLTASAQTTVSISTGPDYLVSTNTAFALVDAGASVNFTVDATAYNGFSSPVQVTITGLPPGVTASPSSFSIIPTAAPGTPQVVTLTAAVTAPVPANVYIDVQGVGGTLSHQAFLQFGVVAPTITLSAQPNSLTVPAGAIAQTELFVSGLNGSNANGTVTETVSGLPVGVTVTPASVTIPASKASQVFYLQAAATGAQAGSITFTLNYGPYSAKATALVTIGPAQSGTPVLIKSRSSYIRTASTTDFGALPAPTLTLFHSATGYFFSSDPYLGHLYVVDSVKQKLVATINIPGAFGIDQAPDGSVIYVGTFGGDIYLVDPVKLTITKRIPSSTISQYGFPANAVFAMADGKLLLMQYFLYPYYSWVDGNGPIALWNPADNSIVKFVQTLDNDPMPERLTCFQNLGHLILTAGRTRAIIAPVPGGGGNSQLCSLDPETGTWNLANVYDSPTQDLSAIAEFSSSPDGKTVVTFDETKIYVLDSTTLQIKNSFPAPVRRFNFVYPNMVISPDNQTLYLSDPSTGTVLYAYNLTSGQLIGWIPEVEASSTYKWYEPSNPYMQAISSNGLIAGPLDNGIGLIDFQAVNPPPIGTTFNFSALQVATGPPSGGTDTAWIENQYPQTSPAPLGSVYFGSNAASEVSYGSSLIYASTPAGASGPVDVRITTTDGGQQLLPEAFSYGPWIEEAPTSYATAEGGGPAQVFGYGFGPVGTSGNLSVREIAPPNGVALSVGGQSANLTGYVPAPYISSYPVTQPFPTQGIEYTVPSGVAGTSSPIVLTSASGTTSGQSPIMQYLPATQRFSAPGSQLIDGVYDSHRNLYYFTDTNQVRVFSRTQAQWLSPIPIPTPAHPAGPQQLFGLALSPDGSKLALADAGAFAVYVLNPSSPSSITTYQLGSDLTNAPGGVAVTNSGTVYYTTFDQNGDGQFDLYWINPATGNAAYVTGPNNWPLQGDSSDETALRLVMSADGSHVFLSNDGQIVYINTSTNTFQYSNTGPLNSFAGGFELALSPDQSRLAAAGLITDYNGVGVGMQSIGWAAGLDANYVYGAAFSSDGTALFQPGVNAIDVYDGFAGDFLSRISLPFELSQNYRALVSDGTDDIFVAITGATGDGIAVIDLSGVTRPPASPFLKSVPSPSSETAVSQLSTRPNLPWNGQHPFSVRRSQRILPNFVRLPARSPVAPNIQ